MECKRTGDTVLYWSRGDVSKNTFPGETRKEGDIHEACTKQQQMFCIPLVITSAFPLCSSLENGRPLDPADWAVTDVVNYFRTAGFEEQANAFQEQVNPTFCLPPVSHIAHFCCGPGYIL